MPTDHKILRNEVFKMARTTKQREAIEVLSFTEYSNKDSSLIGYATVRVDRITVSGVKLMYSEKNKSWFINMPSQKGKDGEYYNTVWCDAGSKTANKDLYDEICEAVKAFYEEGE